MPSKAAEDDLVPEQKLGLRAIGRINPVSKVWKVFPDLYEGLLPVHLVEGVLEVDLEQELAVMMDVRVLVNGTEGMDKGLTSSSNPHS